MATTSRSTSWRALVGDHRGGSVGAPLDIGSRSSRRMGPAAAHDGLGQTLGERQRVRHAQAAWREHAELDIGGECRFELVRISAGPTSSMAMPRRRRCS